RQAVRAALRVEFALMADDVPDAVHGTVAFFEAALWDHLNERLDEQKGPSERLPKAELLLHALRDGDAPETLAWRPHLVRRQTETGPSPSSGGRRAKAGIGIASMMTRSPPASSSTIALVR